VDGGELLVALAEGELLGILDEAARALGILFDVHSTLLSGTPEPPSRRHVSSV
jgi:hypothetical protein